MTLLSSMFLTSAPPYQKKLLVLNEIHFCWFCGEGKCEEKRAGKRKAPGNLKRGYSPQEHKEA